MLLNFNPTTRQIPIELDGTAIGTFTLDSNGQHAFESAPGAPELEIESLSDKDVMNDVMNGIERANRDQKHTLFTDHDPEEPSERFYVTIPKDLNIDRPTLLRDHESLWFATDLLEAGKLSSCLRISLENDLF